MKEKEDRLSESERALVAGGRAIDAMREYRERTGARLAVAHRLVRSQSRNRAHDMFVESFLYRYRILKGAKDENNNNNK